MTRAPNHRLRRPPATPSAPLEDAVCVTQGVDRGPPGLEGIGRPWQMPRKGSAPLKWMRLPDRYASWDPPSGSRGAKLRQSADGSDFIDPMATAHSSSLKAWVDRPGGIYLPGVNGFDGPDLRPRGRLPDCDRPGDPSSGACGQTVHRNGHSSGFTEPWTMEYVARVKGWVDRTGEIYLPGVDAPDGRGSPQRARLPRRKRPGDPSPGAWSTTLRQYGRGSGFTEPWTTDRARPMETGVHRSGEICPPGATDPNGAGPPQRVRLPDRNRPGDSSSGAYGQTTTESAHGSGFTEPWLTEHARLSTRWVERAGGIYLPGVKTPDGVDPFKRVRLSDRHCPGAPLSGACGTTLYETGGSSGLTELPPAEHSPSRKVWVGPSGGIYLPGVNVAVGDGSPPRWRPPNGHRPGVRGSETRGQRDLRDDIGPGLYKPWTQTHSTALKGWVAFAERTLSGGMGCMSDVGRAQSGGVQDPERHGGQSVGSGRRLHTARVRPRAQSGPLTQMQRTAALFLVWKHAIEVMRTRGRPRHTTRHAHRERLAGQGREKWSRRRCLGSHGPMAPNRRVL